MKIYPNPNFTRTRQALPTPLGLPVRRERVTDTMRFVTQLQARNTRALETPLRLREVVATPQADISLLTERERPRERERHSTRLTGPPIEVPGGHVHSISSRCTASR